MFRDVCQFASTRFDNEDINVTWTITNDHGDGRLVAMNQLSDDDNNWGCDHHDDNNSAARGGESALTNFKGYKLLEGSMDRWTYVTEDGVSDGQLGQVREGYRDRNT